MRAAVVTVETNLESALPPPASSLLKGSWATAASKLAGSALHAEAVSSMQSHRSR